MVQGTIISFDAKKIFTNYTSIVSTGIHEIFLYVIFLSPLSHLQYFPQKIYNPTQFYYAHLCFAPWIFLGLYIPQEWFSSQNDPWNRQKKSIRMELLNLMFSLRYKTTHKRNFFWDTLYMIYKSLNVSLKNRNIRSEKWSKIPMVALVQHFFTWNTNATLIFAGLNVITPLIIFSSNDLIHFC